MPAPASSKTSLSITNPLVLYRALLSTQRIDPDPAQHRLALHLQTLYNRLKDYEPVVSYGSRIQQLHRTLASTPANPAPGTNHDAPRQSILGSIFEKTQDASKDSLALTKVLTSAEAAKQLDSPKGLLLHGEVGTGKSMLIDLFAECLPNRKKRRWHYNTFMLDVLAKLERIRKSRELIIPTSLGQQDDYSLLWLARDMISTSPVLFLDEFQLPDRAAAKILTNLMNCFFQLGGVLVATSNRMPEELDKAAGMHFAPPPATVRFRGLSWRRASSIGDRNTNEFSEFLEVLRVRCDVWQIEGSKDYRRREAIGSEAPPSTDEEGHSSVPSATMSSSSNKDGNQKGKATQSTSTTPITHLKFYHLIHTTSPPEVLHSILNIPASTRIPWLPQTLYVYSRPLSIPRAHIGCAYFTFPEICSTALGPTSAFGPADYVTLASHFHTIIVTDVPVLSLLQKNEARRFITLLDALYEARCKLAIFAAAGPDDIFFPKATSQTNHSERTPNESVKDDAIYSETLSEIYQDITVPFRPNASSYVDSTGADATHARFAGLFDEDRAERQRGLSARHEASNVDVGDARLLSQNFQSDTTANTFADTESGESTQRSGPNFSVGSAFTGEDEKFAFKRARSRLWELCSARWWAREHVPSEDKEDDPVLRPSWWRPVSREVRSWERNSPVTGSVSCTINEESVTPGEEGMGIASSSKEDKDSVLFRHGGTSPFRSSADAPPKLSWTHIWGLMSWGKKAGRWGQGPDAFKSGSSDHEKEAGEEYVQRRNAWRKQDDKPPKDDKPL